MPKILLTGSSGRLGTEIKKLTEVVDFKYDINLPFPKISCDLIIHAAAFTDVAKADKDRSECFKTNTYGTFNLVESYKNVPFVYISTEYAKNPKEVYAFSKYIGEEVVKTHPMHLILRTLFKPTPFPFDSAYTDQYTQGDYVDVIAKRLLEMIKEWDKKTSRLDYLGTGRKTMFELAKRTRPDVKPMKVDDYVSKTGVQIPKDYL